MLELNKDNFTNIVKESSGYVLVDYFGATCEPCKALIPQLEILEANFKNSVNFVKFNIALDRRLAIKEKVLGVPTITLYKDGIKLSELTKEFAIPENIAKMLEDNIK